MTRTSSRITRAIIWFTYSAVCGAVLSLAGVYLYLDPQIPRAETYRHVQLETPLRVYSSEGELLAEFGERRRIPISLERVPPLFVRAILDTEDKRFYEHVGIDFISLTNDTLSLVKNLMTEGGVGPGASTITMQLARNVSFGLEVTFIRKFKEMLLALQIERELTKDEILELYINLVPFGKRAYGAEAAAQTYYGRSLDKLNLAQLAMLAGIPQAPTAGNPINGPERSVVRRNVVLQRMYEQGSIGEAEWREATAAPITARLYEREIALAAPYPAEWARQQLIGQIPDLYTGGYEVTTTLRAPLQYSAQQA
jgi:penicillin-binding protein 1A